MILCLVLLVIISLPRLHNPVANEFARRMLRHPDTWELRFTNPDGPMGHILHSPPETVKDELLNFISKYSSKGPDDELRAGVFVALIFSFFGWLREKEVKVTKNQ